MVELAVAPLTSLFWRRVGTPSPFVQFEVPWHTSRRGRSPVVGTGVDPVTQRFSDRICSYFVLIR